MALGLADLLARLRPGVGRRLSACAVRGLGESLDLLKSGSGSPGTDAFSGFLLSCPPVFVAQEGFRETALENAV